MEGLTEEAETEAVEEEAAAEEEVVVTQHSKILICSLDMCFESQDGLDFLGGIANQSCSVANEEQKNTDDGHNS